MNQERHDDKQTVAQLESLKIIRRNLNRKFQLTADVNKRNDAAKAWGKADELIKLIEKLYKV